MGMKRVILDIIEYLRRHTVDDDLPQVLEQAERDLEAYRKLKKLLPGIVRQLEDATQLLNRHIER